MIVLLWAFTLFDAVVAVASIGQGLNLLRAEERAHWRSKTLLALAVMLAWTFPLAAVGGVALGWMHFEAGRLDSVPIVLAPIGWLLLMGVVFALVDFLEDGILGNGRAPTPPL